MSVRISSDVETWPLKRLRPHPENSVIFGHADEDDSWAGFVASIKANGQWDPLVVKQDGTVLSGHRRLEALTALGAKEALVRIASADSYVDEALLVIRSNTDRRQLSPREIALAFKRLKEIERAHGGAKKQHGGDRKSQDARKNQGGPSPTLKSRDEAAAILGVGTDEARALETVFTRPGVPEEIKTAVDKGRIAPTPAARAIRAEEKRQGGEIKEPAPLRAWAAQKTAPPTKPERSEHEDRVRAEAARLQRDLAELFDAYKLVDRVLTRRPLKSVIGPSEHHEYAGLIRDIAIRAWREIEAVQGSTNTGRQMTLAVLSGGKP